MSISSVAQDLFMGVKGYKKIPLTDSREVLPKGKDFVYQLVEYSIPKKSNKMVERTIKYFPNTGTKVIKESQVDRFTREVIEGTETKKIFKPGGIMIEGKKDIARVHTTNNKYGIPVLQKTYEKTPLGLIKY